MIVLRGEIHLMSFLYNSIGIAKDQDVALFPVVTTAVHILLELQNALVSFPGLHPCLTRCLAMSLVASQKVDI
jgi:hypothetical protein